ncbi:MAG: hypothetical protein WD749_06515 [Phycisphaerales bacterium]
MSQITERMHHRDVTHTVAASPGEQAFWLLRAGFTAVPIVAGMDKFFHALVNWDQYLAPWVARIVGGAHGFMLVVGVVEIIAGIGVAIWPRIFGWVVAAWLLGIVVNLLTLPGYYDVALRDVGLMVGAVALALLARGHHAEHRAAA